MSRKSGVALLREDLTGLAVESRELRETVSRLETMRGGMVVVLKAEIDRLRLEMV